MYFDLSNCAGGEEVTDFCWDFNPEFDEFNYEIARDYLYKLDSENVKTNLHLELNEYMKMSVIGWHLVSAVLGLPHDLDLNVSCELSRRVLKETEKITYDRIFSEKEIPLDTVGNKLFFYKKALTNVLKENDNIGSRLHPRFVGLNFQDPMYIDIVCTGLYKAVIKASWAKDMGLGVGTCTHSAFFYLR